MRCYRLGSKAVMQRTATPCTSVRIRSQPPKAASPAYFTSPLHWCPGVEFDHDIFARPNLQYALPPAPPAYPSAQTRGAGHAPPEKSHPYREESMPPRTPPCRARKRHFENTANRGCAPGRYIAEDPTGLRPAGMAVHPRMGVYGRGMAWP